MNSQQQDHVPIILLLIDGLSDHSHSFDGAPDLASPLKQAHTPHMDSLAGQGVLGLHDPVQAGLACGSDTAHMSIFGYNPMQLYDGRGSFEAMGSGQSMQVGDIAFKSNFAFMDLDSQVVVRRRVDRTFAEWGVALCDSLDNVAIKGFPEYKIFCKHATEHRCGVKITGPRLNTAITGTDPLKDNLRLIDCKALPHGNEDAAMTAKVVAAASETITEILMSHPLVLERKAAGKTYPNLVTLRGASQLIAVPSFLQKH